MIKHILKRLSVFVTKAWGGILITAILLSVLSINYAMKLNVNMDIMNLLPVSEPIVKDFMDVSKLFGFHDKLIAVVSIEKGLDISKAKDFMENFAVFLKDSDLINNVDFKIPNISFDDTERKIQNKIKIDNVFYMSPEKKMFLMFIFPKGSSGDIKFSKKLMDIVRKIENKTRLSVSYNISGLHVNYTGGYIIGLQESILMKKNIKLTMIFSLICIILIFFIIFNRFTYLFCIMISLFMSISLTLMIAYFLIGVLNIMTIAFAAILAGLGIDFGVHITNRFILEISLTQNLYHAIKNTIVSTGESIFYSCMTTSLVFFSLIFTKFNGAVEFGFLVGIGIIICMLIMIFVLPAFLIVWFKVFISDNQNFHQDKYSFYDRFMDFVGRYSKQIAVAIIIFLIGSAGYVFSQYKFPEFDNRLDNMSSIKNSAIKLQRTVLKKFGNYFEPIVLISKDKDPNKVLDMMRKVLKSVQILIDTGEVIKFENIFNYLPSIEKRSFLIKRIRKIKNPKKTYKYLLKILKKDISKKKEYNFFIKEKEKILYILNNKSDLQLFSYEELNKIFPENILKKFIIKDKLQKKYAAISYLYPKQRIASKDQINQLYLKLNINKKNIKITGLSLMVGYMEYLMKKEIGNIILFIALILSLVLFIIYRDIKVVCVSIIPLIFGLAATFITMIIFNIKLNYMNIIAFPLIIGIGIDDSIHMLHNYFENKKRNINIMLKQTGRAIFVTSITTVIGFGSLVFSQHTGLISLGILTSIGIMFCLFSSLFVLPGILELIMNCE